MIQQDCPKCHSNQIESLGRIYPIYPAGCLMTLGFPLAIFHQGQIPNRFHCEACGHHFAKRSGLAKFNLVFFAIMGLPFLLFALLMIGSIIRRLFGTA